ncbi:hypothetical protein J1785_21765 [Rahnella sp. SL6]|uniref:hypothetical protein n=1 Tax=Rahnella perminowiae TaxID=2816244 RepID=UPI001C279BD0|nr:hypothetical protein [Rahnella perminowiae]MBU9812344.1 hypothetical protein [Rahnella perminowiae]
MSDKNFNELPGAIQEAASETLKNILSQAGCSFLLRTDLKPGFAVEVEPATKLALSVKNAFITLCRDHDPTSDLPAHEKEERTLIDSRTTGFQVS